MTAEMTDMSPSAAHRPTQHLHKGARKGTVTRTVKTKHKWGEGGLWGCTVTPLLRVPGPSSQGEALALLCRMEARGLQGDVAASQR